MGYVKILFSVWRLQTMEHAYFSTLLKYNMCVCVYKISMHCIIRCIIHYIIHCIISGQSAFLYIWNCSLFLPWLSSVFHKHLNVSDAFASPINTSLFVRPHANKHAKRLTGLSSRFILGYSTTTNLVYCPSCLKRDKAVSDTTTIVIIHQNPKGKVMQAHSLTHTQIFAAIMT